MEQGSGQCSQNRLYTTVRICRQGGILMKFRHLTIVLCAGVLGTAVWSGGGGTRPTAQREAGRKWRPASFARRTCRPADALVAGEDALLIDAPASADGLKKHGVRTIDAVLLTHHHRDTAAFTGRFRAEGVPVRPARLRSLADARRRAFLLARCPAPTRFPNRLSRAAGRNRRRGLLVERRPDDRLEWLEACASWPHPDIHAITSPSPRIKEKRDRCSSSAAMPWPRGARCGRLIQPIGTIGPMPV